MAFVIDPREVDGILLADGWHFGIEGLEFDNVTFEYERWTGGPGFRCTDENGRLLFGPMESLLAVAI